MDDSKPINAKDIIENPDGIHGFNTPYILVRDQSLRTNFTNHIRALNILFEYGWDVINIWSDASGSMYALCQNPHAKRKRDKMSEQEAN